VVETEARDLVQRRLANEREELSRLLARMDAQDKQLEGAIAGGDDGSSGTLCDMAQFTFLHQMDVTIRSVLTSRIERVERAYRSLEAGSYGRCEDCHGEIAPDRLEAVPDATLCISCQRLRERRTRAARLHAMSSRSSLSFQVG
jgi:DnaK suppressor protein